LRPAYRWLDSEFAAAWFSVSLKFPFPIWAAIPGNLIKLGGIA